MESGLGSKSQKAENLAAMTFCPAANLPRGQGTQTPVPTGIEVERRKGDAHRGTNTLELILEYISLRGRG